MKGNLALMTVVAVLLTVPPASAAEVAESITVQVGTDRFQVVAVYNTTDLDARDIRRDVDDDFGNDDGQVTQDELDRFNEAVRIENDQPTPDCFSNLRLVELNTQTPVVLRLAGIKLQNAVGPVTSDEHLFVTTYVELGFAEEGISGADAAVDLDEFQDLGEAVGCFFGDTFEWTGYQYAWSYGANAPANSPSGGASYTSGPPPGCCDPTATPQALGADDQGFGASQSTDEFTLLLIHPYEGSEFHLDTLRPEGLSEYWDGKGLRAEGYLEMDTLSRDPILFRVGSKSFSPFSGDASETWQAVGAVALGSLVVVGAAMWMTEMGRYALIKLLFLVPGFTRFDKDQVLEHDRRDHLYQFIKENPGSSFSDLRRVTEMANGTLVHHLRILEQQEYIKPLRDGFRTRFYVRGPKITPEPYLTRTQQQILDTISSNPGITQKELSKLIGLPRESISYHAKKLRGAGKPEVRRHGMWRLYYDPE